MTTLRVTKFGGLAPRLSDENALFTLARVAEDVDLSRGTIRALRAPSTLAISVPTGSRALTVGDDCCAVTSLNQCTSVAKDTIPCSRYVFSGFASYLQHSTSLCGPRCRVGFSCELTALRASSPPPSALVTGALAREPRTYTYRLTNSFGDLSAPAPPTMVDADFDAEVTLSGFPETDDTGSCPTEVIIYRTVADLSHGNDKEDIDNSYFEIGRVAFGTKTFTDDGTFIGDEMLEEYVDPPADGLADVQLTSDGVFAARHGSEVHFSARGNLANWPIGERVQTEHDKPVRLISASNVSYLLTETTASIISHTVTAAGCRAVKSADLPMPIVAYGSAVIFGEHVIYAAQAGLVMLAPNGQYRVLTAAHYTEEEWGALAPWTCTGAVRRGYYYAFLKDATLRLRLPDTVFGSAGQAELTTLSARATAAFTTDHDELYYIEGAEVKLFEGGLSHLEGKWASVDWTLPGVTALSAYSVRETWGHDVITEHTSDDRVISSHVVANKNHRRLPLYSGSAISVSFRTSGEITDYRIATSVQELANVKS